jgi:hypothetical protein
MDKIQLSEELHDAIYHCMLSAENNDNSLGDSNFKKYDMVRTWLDESTEIGD